LHAFFVRDVMAFNAFCTSSGKTAKAVAKEFAVAATTASKGFPIKVVLAASASMAPMA